MARILVDTSAWIEFYHPQGSEAVKRAVAEALEAHEVAVVAPVAVELLSGAKTDSNFLALQRDLGALSFLPLDWGAAIEAARLGWALARARRGVPTIDLLIAAAAQVSKYGVWHYGDAHFVTIAKAGGPPQRNLKGAPGPV